MKVEQQKDSKQKKIVQIEDLSVSFDGMEVVKHVNIEVNSGEIVGTLQDSWVFLNQINHLTDTHGASVKAGTGDIRENNRGWGSIKRSRQTF